MTETQAMPKPSAPFAVVLEDALCPTDLATEARVQAFSANPVSAFSTKAPPPLPPAALPLDEVLIEAARTAQSQGRKTLLVTRRHAEQAKRIAEGLGVFDEVVDLSDTADQDLPTALAARYDAPPEIAATPARERAGTKAQIRAIRPHQWSKNLLVFIPALAAHDASGLGPAVAAFAAFSLTASSVYVLNDLSDLAADRAHPRKRFRPFAAGTLGVSEGIRMAAGLIVGALAVSLLFLPLAFLGVLALYYAATFAYSFWLKRKLVIDVIMLASLYTIRIIAGAVAASVTLSPWMLGFSMFLFLSLAAVKRQAELTDMVRAGDTERAGRGYVPDDLPVIRSMALAAGYAAVLVLALYISSADVTVLYSTPEALWLLCPILLYWISRMVMTTHRGKMTDDPIVYAAKDRVSLAVLVTGTLIVIAASEL